LTFLFGHVHSLFQKDHAIRERAGAMLCRLVIRSHLSANPTFPESFTTISVICQAQGG
jgi:hypothetical protein